MRTMEFTIEDTEALKPGMEVNVSEGVLPTSYYYMIEHALGMRSCIGGKNDEKFSGCGSCFYAY